MAENRSLRDLTYTIPWNLLLITIGAVLIGLGIKAVAIPHGFFSSGFSGLGLILFYALGGMSPGLWFLVLNIPVFILGWLFVSRRFFFYSLYGMLLLSWVIDLIDYQMGVHDPMLAAIAAGSLIGAGSGTALRSLGSTGGTDIISIILHRKWNLRIGMVNFVFNLGLFGLGLFFLNTERILYSLTMVFVTSMVLEYFLGLFNQRKMVLVISDKSEEIADAVLHQLHRGTTFLHGQGAYTRVEKKILLTVVNNIQLKRLEEAIFTIDPDAFVIFENTLNVLGRGFSRRKVY